MRSGDKIIIIVMIIIYLYKLLFTRVLSVVYILYCIVQHTIQYNMKHQSQYKIRIKLLGLFEHYHLITDVRIIL